MILTRPSDSFAKACAASGISIAAEVDVQSVTLSDLRGSESRPLTVIQAGVWPGVHRPDPQVAGATSSLWLDQNCSLVNYIRALYPRLAPVLGYMPDQEAGVSPDQLLPFDSLELALVDAWVSGGNYVMALHPRFQEALKNGADDAVAAWRKLGRTARFLRANEPLFRQPALPLVTVLVDDSALTLEIAHLCFRHNVSPALVAASNPPAPDPAHRWVMVAVGIDAPKDEARTRILDSAVAGTTVVVDGRVEDAWWRASGLQRAGSDAERDYYTLGKGRIVAYRNPIEDPGMLALDVIDIVTQPRRPARIWNCNAGLVMATLAPRPRGGSGAASLHIVNYGRPVDLPVLARIQGRFKNATLIRPEAEPQSLQVSPRGNNSEVTIPGVDRLATVVFG
jgi:hypothetical protein